MTAEEIKGIISNELTAEPNVKNVFGFDLAKRLIEPTKQKYKSANNPILGVYTKVYFAYIQVGCHFKQTL